jgi:hypothetical protein
MLEIAEQMARYFPSERIALVHDHCPYDAILADSFSSMKGDSGFEHREMFTTITAETWRDCAPLQPADLLAYENLKEAELKSAGKRRRKTLELLLDLDSFGGRAKNITATILKTFWKDRFNARSRRNFLAMSRLPTVRKPRR